MHELDGSGFAFQVILAACAVQGSGAPASIAGAIVACQRAEVDVIAVVRGGGARTDLVAYDDEAVARAIATSPVPVLTGIGHEVDTAVADEVAHTRLKTPTACAAHLVARVADADHRAHHLWARIATAAAHRLADQDRHLGVAAARTADRVNAVLRQADHTAVAAAQRARELATARLTSAEHRLVTHAGAARLHARHRLAVADADADRAVRRLHETAERRLDHASRALDQADTTVRLLDPVRVLARGWSITTTDDGTVVRSVADAEPGTRLTTRVVDGAVTSTVDETPPEESA